MPPAKRGKVGGLQAVVVHVDIATVLEDHFDLKATAPFVFDNTTMEHPAAAVDFWHVGAAAGQADRHIDKAVAAWVNDLQNGFDRGAAIARAGLLHEQLMRLVMKARIVAARGWWLGSTARWFQALVRGSRLASGYQENGNGQQHGEGFGEVGHGERLR